jgi:hypothetical protein
MSRVSLPALRHITGGDNNPDCLLSVFAPVSRVALSLAAGPAVPAIACFARLCTSEDRTPYQEPFPFSPVTSVPDDARKYTQDRPIPEEKFAQKERRIRPGVQTVASQKVVGCIKRWIN